jgi:hypothetical protein
MGVQNAWNIADTWACDAIDNNYVIAIDGMDGEICPGRTCGVGGLMATVVADNGDVMNSDATWKCWNAEGHADTRPPGNWMEYDFDDSAWCDPAPHGACDRSVRIVSPHGADMHAVVVPGRMRSHTCATTPPTITGPSPSPCA